MPTTIKLADIRLDGGTQPRTAMCVETVGDYAEAIGSGIALPPVTVYYDGSAYWLADGFHRCAATSTAGLLEIECDVIQGTLEDAQWHSFSANKNNGLRRSNDDYQQDVSRIGKIIIGGSQEKSECSNSAEHRKQALLHRQRPYRPRQTLKKKIRSWWLGRPAATG
jgi:hypothetical protein